MFWAIIGRIDYKLNANSCFKVVLTLTGETPWGIVFFIRNYIRFKSTESSVEDKELCVSSCLCLFGHGICQFGGCQESLGTSSSPCKVPLPLALLPSQLETLLTSTIVPAGILWPAHSSSSGVVRAVPITGGQRRSVSLKTWRQKWELNKLFTVTTRNKKRKSASNSIWGSVSLFKLESFLSE